MVVVVVVATAAAVVVAADAFCCCVLNSFCFLLVAVLVLLMLTHKLCPGRFLFPLRRNTIPSRAESRLRRASLLTVEEGGDHVHVIAMVPDQRTVWKPTMSKRAVEETERYAL